MTLSFTGGFRPRVFLITIALFALGLLSTTAAKAQSAGTAPTRNFLYPTNSNMNGCITSSKGKANDSSETVGINQLFTVAFDPSNPNQASVSGLVQNTISNFESTTNVRTNTAIMNGARQKV